MGNFTKNFTMSESQFNHTVEHFKEQNEKDKKEMARYLKEIKEKREREIEAERLVIIEKGKYEKRKGRTKRSTLRNSNNIRFTSLCSFPCYLGLVSFFIEECSMSIY